VVKIGLVVPEICSRARGQTPRQTDTLITLLRSLIGCGVTTTITRCRAKPNVSPPGCATSHRGIERLIRDLSSSAACGYRVLPTRRNLAKIGPADLGIIDMTRESLKIRNRSRTYSPRACFQQPGGLNKTELRATAGE